MNIIKQLDSYGVIKHYLGDTLIDKDMYDKFKVSITLLNSSNQPLIYNLLSYCRMGLYEL